MYDKIVVPLDQSTESTGILPLVQELLAPEGEGILLHIIPPGRARSMGEFRMLGSQVEEEERIKVMANLKRIVSQMGAALGSWRCEVVVSTSVADGIADFARREEADLIAMYTHDRKGLAKLIKGSIAEKVQKSATTQVQVFGPRELVAI